MIVSCFDYNVHWITQTFDRGDDITSIFVNGNLAEDDKFRVIGRPF